MAFNAEMRKEKPKDGAQPADPNKDPKKDAKLDKALKDTFPASDPVAKETPVTGSRARKPKLPE
ncbi:MAG: hypothetical protein AB7R90_13110 [Reyranellaceae bacterium]